jgi:hypothetical protein
MADADLTLRRLCAIRLASVHYGKTVTSLVSALHYNYITMTEANQIGSNNQNTCVCLDRVTVLEMFDE